MIPRAAQATIEQLAQGYPIVAVTGPRQSGKTTLVRTMFSDRPYVSLEDLDERELAQQDPRGFLSRFPDGAVFDEVQRTPALFSYLQTRVDQDRRNGRFILTGSQQFDLLSNITQSLAGRVALVPLLPFSLAELQAAAAAPESLESLLFAGLYPPLYDRDLKPEIWYGNYVRTYLERDVRQMINVRDLSTFQRFVRMCAARTGQLLSLSGLASDCGITHNTAAAWLSVLEASYIVHRLPPHYNNFNKRLVKTPKLYFYDPGLAAWLLGIEAATELEIHSMRGPLFETWVVSELLKARFNQALTSNLFFWRDRSGNEVDVVIERGPLLEPVEVKSGQTVTSGFFTGLETWRGIAGEAAGQPWLVYGGDRRLRRSGVEVVPWREIGEVGQPLSVKEEGEEDGAGTRGR
ncbi:MAG TPA: ATP-binding protein [Thermoanaerobaculia bacterium]|nr:ATP-binding protein [Thermoanaerobaculia bacterium]